LKTACYSRGPRQDIIGAKPGPAGYIIGRKMKLEMVSEQISVMNSSVII